MSNIKLYHGNSLNVLKTIPDNSIDTIITDPPYGISFMGKKWDYDVPSVEIWIECLRVLKPGGYLLAFASTRTQHRMAVRIEDAGFEIRDMIAWVYGTGFPKSLDVGKAIDKIQGNKRETGKLKFKAGTQLGIINDDNWKPKDVYETIGHSQWEGYGTALKPAMEPITVARKPIEGTVAQNVLKYETGAINIDDCRIEGKKPSKPQPSGNTGKIYGFKNGVGRSGEMSDNSKGRFPANIIHDGSEEVLDLFPGSDESSPARFFYCAKASAAERKDNNHPTVKPIALMEYLCKLTKSPYGGTVLDPFMGSGTTGVACKNTNRDFIGIEIEEDSFKIAQKRIVPEESAFEELDMFE